MTQSETIFGLAKMGKKYDKNLLFLADTGRGVDWPPQDFSEFSGIPEISENSPDFHVCVLMLARLGSFSLFADVCF